MNYNIKQLSRTQKEISEFFVSKNIENFERTLTKVRDVFDEIWDNPLSGKNFIKVRSAISKYKKRQSPNKLKDYPEGFCFPITNFCYQLFTEYLYEIDPSFTLLTKYLEQDGTLKIIWGDLRDVYFQTAFQIGEWYIDVAYDAIDRNKPKIRCAKFENSDFKDITSIEQYITIKNNYHQGKMYINNILPNLFLDHPFIFVQHNGVIALDTNKVFKALINKNKFELLKNYLVVHQDAFLPKNHQARIMAKLKDNNSPFLMKYIQLKECSLNELQLYLEKGKSLVPNEDLQKVTKTLNFLLTK